MCGGESDDASNILLYNIKRKESSDLFFIRIISWEDNSEKFFSFGVIQW